MRFLALVPIFLVVFARQQPCKSICIPPRTCSQGECVDFTCVKFNNQVVAELSPSILMSFALTDCSGAQIDILTTANFVVKENGNFISSSEGPRAVIPHADSLMFRTMVLVDIGGVGPIIDQLKQALSLFVNRVASPTHAIALFVFDGSTTIRPVLDYTTNVATLLVAVGGLDKVAVVDSATNLHGALIEALSVCERDKPRSPSYFSVASLVIFVPQVDVAAVNSVSQVVAAVKATPTRVYCIGFGKVNVDSLQQFGKTAFHYVENNDTLSQTFKTVAQSLVKSQGNIYVLQYCTPSRTGRLTLTVELANSRITQSDNQLRFSFEADGFGNSPCSLNISSVCGSRCGLVNGVNCGPCALSSSSTTALSVPQQTDVFLTFDVAVSGVTLNAITASRTFRVFLRRDRMPSRFFYDSATPPLADACASDLTVTFPTTMGTYYLFVSLCDTQTSPASVEFSVSVPYVPVRPDMAHLKCLTSQEPPKIRKSVTACREYIGIACCSDAASLDYQRGLDSLLAKFSVGGERASEVEYSPCVAGLRHWFCSPCSPNSVFFIDSEAKTVAVCNSFISKFMTECVSDSVTGSFDQGEGTVAAVFGHPKGLLETFRPAAFSGLSLVFADENSVDCFGDAEAQNFQSLSSSSTLLPCSSYLVALPLLLFFVAS